jgi:hypothetical protein
MFKKLFSQLRGDTPKPAPNPGAPTAYASGEANGIYELLFCDRPELFRSGSMEGPWGVIFGQPADYDALLALALDEGAESRVRALAFNRLRAEGQPVPPKIYLGTILEIHMQEGLDTMAVYPDGGIRYINHTGAMSLVEGPVEQFAEEVRGVVRASLPLVQAIGPWDKERLPRPSPGRMRISMLVSDGLYFGEGTLGQFTEDPMAKPVYLACHSVLQKLVAAQAG